MAKSDSYDNLIPAEYSALKDKIIAGTVTQEETQKLYNDFQIIKGGYTVIGKVSALVLDELYTKSQPDNFHNFVKQLVEAEKEGLKISHPITKEEQLKAGQPIKDMDEAAIASQEKKRASNFCRNSSLAKRAIILEATKESFGKEVFNAIKTNDPNEAIKGVGSLEIPDKIKDTLHSIKTFYTENNQSPEFYVNYSFHIVKTVLQEYANQEIKNPDQNSKFIRDQQTTLLSSYDLKDPNVIQLIDKQLKGQQPIPEEIENFTQKAKNNLTEALQKKAEAEKVIAEGDKDKQTAKKARAAAKKPSLFNKPSLALKTLTTAVSKIKARLKTKINKNIPATAKPPGPTKTVKSEVISPETNKQTIETKAPTAQVSQWKKATPTALKQESQKWKKAIPNDRVEPPLNTPSNPKSSPKGPSL